MRLVVIETPFAGRTEAERQRNADYLKAALLDSLKRGEAPFASHALYPQVLDDDFPSDRRLGMEAGFAWGKKADAVIVYADLGTSPGMREGIVRAIGRGQQVEYRTLGSEWVLRACGCPDHIQRYVTS